MHSADESTFNSAASWTAGCPIVHHSLGPREADSWILIMKWTFLRLPGPPNGEGVRLGTNPRSRGFAGGPPEGRNNKHAEQPQRAISSAARGRCSRRPMTSLYPLVIMVTVFGIVMGSWPAPGSVGSAAKARTRRVDDRVRKNRDDVESPP